MTGGSPDADSGHCGCVPRARRLPRSVPTTVRSSIGTRPNRSCSHRGCAAPAVGGAHGTTGACASSLARNRYPWPVSRSTITFTLRRAWRAISSQTSCASCARPGRRPRRQARAVPPSPGHAGLPDSAGASSVMTPWAQYCRTHHRRIPTTSTFEGSGRAADAYVSISTTKVRNAQLSPKIVTADGIILKLPSTGVNAQGRPGPIRRRPRPPGSGRAGRASTGSGSRGSSPSPR